MMPNYLGLVSGVISLVLWSQGVTSHVVLCNTLTANQSMYCSCDLDGVDEARRISCFVINPLKPDDEVWKGFARQSELTSLTITSQPASSSLEFVPTEAFLRTPRLQELNIKQCSISELPTNSFVHLEHLSRIALENDEIRNLRKHAVSHLPRLTSLVISDNLIEALRAEALFDLPRLTFLVLDRNNISWIDDNFFLHLSNLMELELWNNKIQHITPYTFNGLKSLRRLDLYKNRLIKLDNYVFSGAPRLHELDLKENRISEIAPNAFHGLFSLTSLHLNRNRLRMLPAHVFRGTPNVMMLELSNNRLESIQRNVIEDLSRATDDHFIMYFRNNQLKCDCRLNWVEEYASLAKYLIFKKELHQMQCTQENIRVTKRVLDINFDDFRCLETSTSSSVTFKASVQRANAIEIHLYKRTEDGENSLFEATVSTSSENLKNVSNMQPHVNSHRPLELVPSIERNENSAWCVFPVFHRTIFTSIALVFQKIMI
ncbi:connectin-like [Limulus polyphemus]|uniref:Connectin-like n=1 Tax=Limulus polyphemus TaxID=6850 RepID=A0ABM1C271_LIMPO|nr:connectin-like [Limulus polyphemus]